MKPWVWVRWPRKGGREQRAKEGPRAAPVREQPERSEAVPRGGPVLERGLGECFKKEGLASMTQGLSVNL